MVQDGSRPAELVIEYPDYDEYSVSETVIDAVIAVRDNTWMVSADGFEQEPTFRVIEERDEIMVAPVGEYGPSTTKTADYEPDSGRLEPHYLKHNGKYVNAIVGDAIDSTLGTLVIDARETFVSERGIQSAAEFDIPDIAMEVREGRSLFPTSKTGQTMAPRDRLVVEAVDDTSAFERWQDAITKTCNRYEVYAGTPHKGTDDLLAPNSYQAGDILTLPEYLDAFYTVNPESVVEAVVSREEIEAAERRRQQRNKLEAEYPELRHTSITNPNAFEEATESNERVEVAERTDMCRDSQMECTLDLLTLYATPSGTIETERVHTC